MIIMLSMFLTVSYYFYLIWLLVPGFSSVLIISLLALMYIVYIGIIVKKPEISVYCFLIIILFFPRSGENYILIQIKEIDLAPISLHLILQSIAAFAICLQLLRRNPVKRKIPKKLNIFCNLFIATYFITLLTTLFYQTQGSYLGVTFTPASAAAPAAFLFSYIFLLGCIYFISKTEQIEKIFILIMAAGFMMVIDLILNIYLKLPMPYSTRSVNPAGCYLCIIYTDTIMVGIIAMASIGCTLYFVYSRAKYIFLFAVPWLFLPINFTYSRANLLGAFFVVTLFLLLSTYFVKTKTAYVVTIVVGILASILVLVGGVFLDLLVSFLQGEVKPEYFTSYMRSWGSRVGAYLRGLDVIYHFFPFGVGPTLMDKFMASPSLPISFPASQDWQSASKFFFKIASGEHTTGPHNVFIEFIGEYGLMGGITLLLFIYNFFANFLVRRRYIKMNQYKYSKPMIMSACVFAVLLGFGTLGIYQGTFDYSIFILFFYLTFLTPGEMQ